jgi:hypothetical protein
MYVPISKSPTKSEDFRPITLLNNDYKLMARIIANRLGPMMEELLQPCQHCVVQGNIFETVATVREAIAHGDTNPAVRLVPGLPTSYQKISHTYVFTILKSCGLIERFIERIKRIYDNAVSSVQVNGPIPTGRSVRQGCPMSMLCSHHA